MNDSPKHQGLRRRMLTELGEMGILNSRVLDAMLRVPRHLFLDSAFEQFAYQHNAFPIGSQQTISHPYTVAFQSSLLDVKKNEKILEIGTGSGYQTAILLELGAEIYSIERHKNLHEQAKKILRKLHYHPRYLTLGDGYKGLVNFAPFDKILVTAAAPEVPQELLLQLSLGGLIVIPLGDSIQQIMTTYLRTTDASFEKMEFGDCKFVPMLKNTKK